MIGSALGAAVGVGLPFALVDHPGPGWLVAGAVLGALIGAAAPPAFAFVGTFVTHGRYILLQRIVALETEVAEIGQQGGEVGLSARKDSATVEHLRALRSQANVLIGRLPVNPITPPDTESRQALGAWRVEVEATIDQADVEDRRFLRDQFVATRDVPRFPGEGIVQVVARELATLDSIIKHLRGESSSQ